MIWLQKSPPIEIRNSSIMSNSTERSTILLLCLGAENELILPKQPSVGDLHRIFRTFGPLRKVIIFSKKVVFKAFLEFDEMNSARKAREVLNDKCVENFGRAKLYFSALQELENSNKYLEYWDAADNAIDITPNRKPFAPISDFNNVFSSDGKVTPETKVDSGEKVPYPRFGNRLTDFFEKLENSAEREKARVEPSSVILVSNLDPEFSSARELFNLFSCFGYVTKLLMMKNLRKALVEYRKIEHAVAAVNEINQANFASFKIKANFSKYPKIDLKKNNKSENSQQFNEVIVPSSAQNRYSENDLNSKQRIGRSILVNCDRAFSSIKHLDIYLAVQDIAAPLGIKLLPEEETGSSSMTLKFEFADLDRATHVLTKLHTTVVKDVALSVSFCP